MQESNRKKAGVLLGIVLAAASLLVGWSMISEESTQSGRKAQQEAIQGIGKTNLRVAIQPTGKGGLVFSRYISCPNDRRCKKLNTISLEDFQLPSDRACSQQYGGPSLAWVVGTLNGQTVNIEMNVSDGCQIARWNKLAPLLGIPKSTSKVS